MGATRIEDIAQYPVAPLRVLGLPGSGKSRAIVARYLHVASRHERPVFVLTWGRDQLNHLSLDLLADGQADAGTAPIATYFGLANDVIARSGQPQVRVIEGLEERLLLAKLIGDGGVFDSEFRAIADSESFQQRLLDLFHTLLQHDVCADAGRRLVAGARNPRARDVFKLYLLFEAALRESDLVSYADVYWRAAAAAAELSDADELRRALWLIDDFQDIDAGQFALLRALVPPGGPGIVNVFGDPMGSYFRFRGTSPRFLTDAFSDVYGGETLHLCGEPLDAGAMRAPLARLVTDVLAEEARGLLGGNGELPRRAATPGSSPGSASSESSSRSPRATSSELPPSSPRTAATSTTTSSSPSTPQGQARVAADLGPLFAAAAGTPAKGDPAHAAVVDAAPASDSDDPAPAGSAVLTTYEDELAEVYAVAAHVRQLIAVDGVSARDIVVVANDKRAYEPLLRAAFAQRGIPLDSGRMPHSGFRDFLRALLRVLASPNDPQATQALTASPFFSYFEEHCVEETGGGADAFVEKFSGELARSAPADWMTHVVERCVLPAAVAYRAVSEDDTVSATVAQALGEWKRYADACTWTRHVADLRTFVRVSTIFSHRSGAPAPSDEEVGLYSPRELRGRFAPVVFVLGCAETLFPSVLQRDTLLPLQAVQDAIDAAVPGAGVTLPGLATADEHLAEQYHLLFHALTRATARLFVSAPSSFNGHATPAPSYVLQDFATPAVGAKGVEPVPPQIRLARICADGACDGDAVAELSPIAAIWGGKREQGTFAVKRFPLSKSSIETYAKCPRLFFFRKVLRIDEPESGPLIVGSVYHDVMAKLAEAYPRRTDLLQSVDENIIAALVDERIDAETGIQSSSFFCRSLRFHLVDMVHKTLRLEREKGEEYTVRAVEEPLAFEYEGWAFTGRADRIDTLTAGAESVMDYKTGSTPKMAATLRKYVVEESAKRPERANWQVPLYAQAYKVINAKWPDSFRHLVQQPGENGFFLTMYIRQDEASLPEAATARGREYNPFSYLLESEIEQVMTQAVAYAEEIFGERDAFAKTTRLSQCRNCYFQRVCERHGD